MRAVLDPNVIISAALSATGAPAEVVRRWSVGEFELIASKKLLGELTRALTYPKIRKRVPEELASRLLHLIAAGSVIADDPRLPAKGFSTDRGDEYLIQLAGSRRAALVSGDSDLLDLRGRIPVFSPRQFLTFLDDQT